MSLSADPVRQDHTPPAQDRDPVRETQRFIELVSDENCGYSPPDQPANQPQQLFGFDRAQ
jgi:hypothetical protein